MSEVTEAELFTALKWVLDHRVDGGLDEDDELSVGGCGCCSDTMRAQDIPPDVLKVLRFMKEAEQ